VALFSWYQEEKHSLFDFLNTKLHYQTYKKEKAAASSDKVLHKLKKFLDQEQPTTVVCHSLGALVFLNYLQKYSPVPSIKKVVLVQADIPDTREIPSNPTKITFINAYCPWDPALLYSWFFHRYKPAGLTGWKQPHVHNRMVPLFGHWNLHASSITQKQFASFVASL
jgi:pimeloyl-ACP methyl ester carboxylesterase